MILAFFSDIHSNSWALDAAVQCARKMFGQDIRFCILGDVINYGPRPIECLRTLKQLDDEGYLYRDGTGLSPIMLKGNHEHAWRYFEEIPGIREKIVSRSLRRADLNSLAMSLYGRQDQKYKPLKQIGVLSLLLNMVAMQVDCEMVDWFRKKMDETNKDYHQITNAAILNWSLTMAHGGPQNALTEGVYSFYDSLSMERYFRMNYYSKGVSARSVFLYGHTHVPMWFALPNAIEQMFDYERRLSLADTIHLFNPGSIGMPRDHDVRPSFLVMDLSTDDVSVCFVRVPLKNESGEDEFGYDAGRKEMLEVLKDEKYPDLIQEWFQKAYLWQFGGDGHSSEQIEYLKKLKRRAGENWVSPEGIDL